MNNKLTNALKWGKFTAIIGIITSALSILSCAGAIFGIITLLGYLKLNKATDDLKQLTMSNPNPSGEDYENLMVSYGDYFKMLGIAQIVAIALTLLGVIFYIVFFAVIMSAVGNSMYYSY